MSKKILILLITLLVMMLALCGSIITHADSSVKPYVTESQTIGSDDRSIILSIYNDPTLSAEDKDEINQLLQLPEWMNVNVDRETNAFNQIRNDYEVIMGLIESYASSEKTSGYLCLGVDGTDESTIRLSVASGAGESFKISEQEKVSLLSVQTSFENMGYELDTIRLKDGTISFESIDGRYTLVHVIHDDGQGRDIDDKYSTIKVSDGWYHKIPD